MPWFGENYFYLGLDDLQYNTWETGSGTDIEQRAREIHEARNQSAVDEMLDRRISETSNSGKVKFRVANLQEKVISPEQTELALRQLQPSPFEVGSQCLYAGRTGGFLHDRHCMVGRPAHVNLAG